MRSRPRIDRVGRIIQELRPQLDSKFVRGRLRETQSTRALALIRERFRRVRMSRGVEASGAANRGVSPVAWQRRGKKRHPRLVCPLARTTMCLGDLG